MPKKLRVEMTSKSNSEPCGVPIFRFAMTRLPVRSNSIRDSLLHEIDRLLVVSEPLMFRCSWWLSDWRSTMAKLPASATEFSQWKAMSFMQPSTRRSAVLATNSSSCSS